MRFNFNRIDSMLIKNRLEYICKQEHFTNYEDTCEYISKNCKGEMRNAISLLETVSDFNTELDINNTMNILGAFSYETMFDLINNIVDGNILECNNIINKVYYDGKNMKQFIDQFIDFVLDCNMYVLCKDISVTKFPSSIEEKVKFATGFDDANKYFLWYEDKLLELKKNIKNESEILSLIKIYVTQMARLI